MGSGRKQKLIKAEPDAEADSVIYQPEIAVVSAIEADVTVRETASGQFELIF